MANKNMARTLSNWEYRTLLSECQALVGRRLEKIYETSPGLFRFDFSFGDSLVVKLGEYFYLTKEPPAAPMQPSGFAMYLRKYLEGRKLESVEGVGSDRIYRLAFREAPALLLEQFAGGNLFLLDGENKIMRAYHSKPSEKRQYKSGEKYASPSSPPFSFPPTMREWQTSFSEKPSATLSALLSRWPVGKSYVQELLSAHGWNEKKAGEMNGEQVQELLAGVSVWMEPGSLSPRVYGQEERTGENKDGPVIEVALVPLSRFEQLPYRSKSFSSFSKAVEYFFTNAQAHVAEPENPQLIRLRKRMEEQRAGLEKVEKEIAGKAEETRWLEERLAELEERRGKILAGESGNEKVDEKKRVWNVPG